MRKRAVLAWKPECIFLLVQLIPGSLNLLEILQRNTPVKRCQKAELQSGVLRPA